MEVGRHNLIGIDVMDIDISKTNKIALEAGRLILKYYGTEYDVYSKDDRAPLGSSLKFCAVAEGFAGGGVVDIIGNPLRYNKATLKDENFIAYSNDAIVKGIMK